MQTAAAGQTLVDRLSNAEASAMVSLLAAAEMATSEAALGESIRKAVELEAHLNTASWDLFDAIGKLADERRSEAQEILADVRNALTSDEHAVELAPTLKLAQARAVRILTKATPPQPQPVITPVRPPIEPPVAKGKRIVDQGSREGLSPAAAKDSLQELTQKTKSGQVLRINLSWLIEEGGNP